MARFIQDSNIQQSKNVKSIHASKEMAADVKSKITIPMYFYNIIVPQLGSYYDLYPVDFDSKIVVCCPLHDEDTPSCRYYEATESFYCFGCQKGGDVIELHRYFAEKMNGIKPDRDEAVYFLYNYFIKGKESETFIVKEQIVQERLNTDADIVKFNFYRYNLEQSISFDKNINLDTKQKLWKVLDMVDVLLSKDLIKSKDAEQFIKDKVREYVTLDSSPKEHKKINFSS